MSADGLELKHRDVMTWNWGARIEATGGPWYLGAKISDSAEDS